VVASLNGAELAGVARIKSVGSLALKLARAAGERPMDIVGMTFVADDITEASVFFHALLARIKELPGVDLCPAPSRKEAVHIRGDSTYVTEYLKNVDPDAEVDIRVEPAGAYQVAKVTALFFGVIPVEIQVQTKEDRKNARIGTASHTVFKDGGHAQKEGLLGSIHERKQHLRKNELNVNGQSKGRGVTLLNNLKV
jgi:copper chaperone CopZ